MVTGATFSKHGRLLQEGDFTKRARRKETWMAWYENGQQKGSWEHTRPGSWTDTGKAGLTTGN